MAKKKKLPELSRRGNEKLRQLCRQFDWTALACAIVVGVCMAIGISGPYELGEENLHGFALWFLLVPAYLPLELVSAINYIFGISIDFAGKEALLLGCCDWFLLALLWLWVRFRARRKEMNFVRTARLFTLIFVCWGIFQIGCFGALWLWKNGGFSSLHKHFEIENNSITE